MKHVIYPIVLFLFLSASPNLVFASWNCTASCKGSEKTILDSIDCGFTPGVYSDFVARCQQSGGHLAGSNCTYCGSYQVCEKFESLSYPVSGSGEDLIAARKAARQSCQSSNSNHGRNGCPYNYHKYFLDESSFQCSEN